MPEETSNFIHKAPFITGRVNKHDRFHIETKFQYKLNSKEKSQKFEIDFFFFIPDYFKVNPRRYTSEDFFSDLKTYVRMDALPFTLQALRTEKSIHNPLTQLKNVKEKNILSFNQQEISDVCYDLKLFGVTLYTAVQKKLLLLRGEDDASVKEMTPATWEDEAFRLTDDLAYLIDEFRIVEHHLLAATDNREIKNTVQVVDDYLSIEYERIMGTFLRYATTHNKNISRSSAIIKKRVQHERELRRTTEQDWFQHGDIKNETAEKVWYSFGLKKKIVASCLFLDTKQSKTAQYINEITAGVAAALAMTLALVVSVVSLIKWQINSLPWLSIAVIAYIFKDRLKEWFRGIGSRSLRPLVADRRTVLYGPFSGKKLGVITELVSFISRRSVPKEIVKYGEVQHFHNLALNFNAENILNYSRRLLIKDVSVSRIHEKTCNIVSIVRYDFRTFLHRMDDPYRSIDLIDTDNMQVKQTQIPRVYHVPMVIRYQNHSAANNSVTYQVLRIVLDRRGIKRIEPIENGN